MDEGSGCGGDWPAFAKRLRRAYGNAVRLELARGGRPTDEYNWKLSLLRGRLTELAVGDWTNAHARRLAKRRGKYGAELLTFVEFEGVPSSNNHAEREVRPAVLMRRASYASQSGQGAATRGVLMSALRTLKRRGLDPMSTVVAALRTYATAGPLPPLPQKVTSEA